MKFIELFLIAVGLSMDAFAVAICKGLSVKKVKFSNAICCGLWFGIFQAGMPVIGYFLGSGFRQYIENFDHWIAFALLCIIGVNMIREAFGEEEESNASFSPKTMLPLAVATSIDALAVGVSFALSDIKIAPAATLIGIITCILSAFGVYIGNIFGSKYRKRAEIVGGCILILIGLKILLEDLGVISF